MKQELSLRNSLSAVSLTTTLPAKRTEEVALLPGAAISVIRRDEGELNAVKKIVKLILELNDALNIQRKMSGEQAAMAAELIIEEFYYLRLHEIQFVFKNVLKGKYGPIYESIDVAKLFTWLNQYASEREQIYWTKSLREHNDLKNQSKC